MIFEELVFNKLKGFEEKERFQISKQNNFRFGRTINHHHSSQFVRTI